MKTTSLGMTIRIWLLACAAGVLTVLNIQAGKPAPPPPKPPVIVYEKGGIWGMAADGSSPRPLLTNTGKTIYRSPAIAPDGATMAFFRMTTAAELCLANLDGTGLVVVHTFTAADPAPAYWFVTWSPDGSKLLFSSKASGGGLFYVDLNNPDVIQALVVGLGFSAPIALSGDLDPSTAEYECKVAIGSSPGGLQSQITVMDIVFDKSGTMRLGDTVTTIPSGVVYTVSWSSSGEYLAYNSIPSNSSSPPHMRLIKPVYAGLEIIGWTDTIVATNINNTSRMAWSPDGQFIVFTQRAAASQFDLFRGHVITGADGLPGLDSVINLSNTTDKSLKTYEANPDWSPAWVPGL